MHPVTQYATDVVFGDLRSQCGIWEYYACKRHLDDLQRVGCDPDFPYVFDETRADRLFRFFEIIPRIDEPDKFIELENWQMFDDGCIFGWVHKDTGKRRFSKSYRRIARGHAKTTNAAVIGNYAMCSDALYPPYKPELAKYEREPIVAVVAVDKEQGENTSWGDIGKMAESCPDVAKRLDVKKTYIKHKTRGGEVRLYSKDTKNKSGDRPSVIIVEEWHEHVNSTVRDRACSGLGKKWQSLEYIITTAGTDAENKPCYADDLYYKKILSGEFKSSKVNSDHIFIMIREIDDDDDPHDMNCWCKANAFFRNGSEYANTLREQVLKEYREAYEQNDYNKIREWLIMRMNRWQTDSENKYFSGCMEKFKKLMVSKEEFQKLTKKTRGHYGFDLGKTRDLSGVAYVTILPDKRLAVSVHGFMPQNRASEHARSDRVPYIEWAADGFVTLTPGDVTDNRYIEQWIYDAENDREWKVDEIDYDGHNAVDMAIRMQETYGENKIVEIPQTCASLNQATKRFRELVLQGKIVAEYSPLLVWCLSNAIEIQNNYGDIKLSKKHKDDTQRIDPVAALMNALTRLIVKVDNTVDINEIIKRRGYAIG